MESVKEKSFDYVLYVKSDGKDCGCIAVYKDNKGLNIQTISCGKVFINDFRKYIQRNTEAFDAYFDRNAITNTKHEYPLVHIADVTKFVAFFNGNSNVYRKLTKPVK